MILFPEGLPGGGRAGPVLPRSLKIYLSVFQYCLCSREYFGKIKMHDSEVIKKWQVKIIERNG